MSVMFECKGLTKKYGNKAALNHVDLSLESGRIVGLLGPNGSGKTTMLKLANGLLTPTEGGIFIDGKKPGIETKAVVSYLPDADYLLDWMNVGELLNMFKSFYDDFRYDRALKMLEELHIQLKDKLKNLSKGNKEKVQSKNPLDNNSFFEYTYLAFKKPWDLSSAGRASALQAEGHRFEPCRSHSF